MNNTSQREDSAASDLALQSLVELETIYRSAPIGLCVLDTELRYVRINEHLAEINGISAADHLGRTVREIVPHLADEVEPLLYQVITTGRPVLDLEISGETSAQPGVRRTWIVNWFPLKDPSGQVLGINSVAEEITARKQAEQALKENEEKLRRLFQQAPAFIAMHEGPEHIYIFSNDLHNKVVGGRPLIGKPLREVMADLSEQGIFERFDHVFTTGEPVLSPAFRALFDRDGDGKLEEGYFSQILQPWFGLSGEVAGVMSFAFEITDRVRAEEELRTLNESLEERVEERTRQVRDLASALTLAEQAERRRVAQILHDDLQQQFYAIQLKLKMLEREARQVAQAALQESIEDIHSFIEEGIETTRHLMVELSPPVLKGEGLREALLWLGGHMQDRFGLHMKLQGHHHLSVPADDMRVLLFQIVRELLFNVVKHAQTNQVYVSFQEQDAYLTIEVVDAGAGFDVKILERQDYSKEGFGLYSARERLGLFGGRIAIDAQPGTGTCVKIQIPIESL